MLKIYGIAMSRANRVLWMARELGLEFEHLQVSFLDGSNRSSDYLAINPNGRIPAIEDDGKPLFESMAINIYLARKHGSILAPQSLMEDALVTQWSFWALTELERRLMEVMVHSTVFREEDRDPDVVTIELEKLKRPLAVLEQHLGQHGWLVGDRFTVADLNVASVLVMSRLANMDLSDYPSLSCWLDKCLSRPLCEWETQRLPSGLPKPDDWEHR
ncbi:MAG: glutathione S-transferase family protein [Sphingomonadaceae bacterium]|nr:glutathione S-transferase family protein [Sphingomonadaceae bacterium]